MPRMGPRVPFAPSLLTLPLHITLHIYFISFRLFILLHVTCVMVNKVVKKKSNRNEQDYHIILSNEPSRSLKSGVVHMGLSDHSMVYAIR